MTRLTIYKHQVMFDENNLNKSGGKKRKIEKVKQVLDNCTGYGESQLVKFVRENAATDIQRTTINNFYQKTIVNLP